MCGCGLDTIDLQDHNSPSAKDHSQNKHSTAEGGTRHAPHHDQSMRDAERDSLDEMARGPVGPQDQRDAYGHGYSDQDDLIDDITRLGKGRTNHGGASDETIEKDNLVDGEGDDQYDDDFMDRISSSPSIDDGEYGSFSIHSRLSCRTDGLFCPSQSWTVPERLDFERACANILLLPSTEDIDFEFVYALHTFVATVEGQANASKGDTMVLLDDSNSYWWLVRVVKDGSIGQYDHRRNGTPLSFRINHI